MIRCMCSLYNFIRIREGRAYQPQYHREAEINMNIRIELENENNNFPTRNSASGLRDYLPTLYNHNLHLLDNEVTVGTS